MLLRAFEEMQRKVQDQIRIKHITNDSAVTNWIITAVNPKRTPSNKQSVDLENSWLELQLSFKSSQSTWLASSRLKVFSSSATEAQTNWIKLSLKTFSLSSAFVCIKNVSWNYKANRTEDESLVQLKQLIEPVYRRASLWIVGGKVVCHFLVFLLDYCD